MKSINLEVSVAAFCTLAKEPIESCTKKEKWVRPYSFLAQMKKMGHLLYSRGSCLRRLGRKRDRMKARVV